MTKRFPVLMGIHTIWSGRHRNYRSRPCSRRCVCSLEQLKMVRSMLGLDAPKVEDVGWHRANQASLCILLACRGGREAVEPDKRARRIR